MDHAIAESEIVKRGADIFDKFYIIHGLLISLVDQTRPGPQAREISITVRLCASVLRMQTTAIATKNSHKLCRTLDSHGFRT